jgi:uncharacterized membrane protein YkoI
VPAEHFTTDRLGTNNFNSGPGKIVKEELEKESGGSGLRYSFDITAAGVIHEIGVDAKNGNILENSIDNGKD